MVVSLDVIYSESILIQHVSSSTKLWQLPLNVMVTKPTGNIVLQNIYLANSKITFLDYYSLISSNDSQGLCQKYYSRLLQQSIV